MDAKRKKRKRGLLLAAAVAAWLLLVASMLLVMDQRYVRFYMTGEEELTLEYGTPWVEPGVYAVTVGRLFGEGEEHLPIETQGAVDTERLGVYELRYRTRWLLSDYETGRRVTVADTTPPVIELRHVEGYTPTWMTGYAEEGYAAWDACDGDLSGRVRRTVYEDRIVYSVTDRSGNSVSVERALPNMVYEPPVITLLGPEHMTVEARTGFEDPGAVARDNLGNDLTGQITVESGVVPYLAGEYEIVYTLTSERGDAVSAVRRVTVTPVAAAQSVTPGERTIYLSFDDGPGPYTNRLLDILKRYGVKATFFVTGANPDYFDCIGRAYREGHSVGVHSYSHDYNRIYESEQAFFDDFFAVEELIYAQTGSYTTLFRFPGGSSNTVSRFNRGIMTRLTQAMTDMGYQYFDWNVVSGDAGETNKTDEIIRNIEDGCALYPVTIVLQHDIKDYSVAAVEAVIQWGLANGYTFRALSADSPTMHHGVNN